MAKTASGATESLGLSQWVRTDGFNMDDFNEDNAIIDEAIASRVRIATGSYVGTGTKGADGANTLVFDFEPKLLLVRGAKYTTNLYGLSNWFIWTEGGDSVSAGMTGGNSCYYTVISRDGTTLSWYNTSDATYQLNISGTTYYYIAIG